MCYRKQHLPIEGCRDRMVVIFTTTYACHH